MSKNQDHWNHAIQHYRKRKLAVRIKKSNFHFAERNDDIDSYSYEDQANTVKMMIKRIFGDNIWF